MCPMRGNQRIHVNALLLDQKNPRHQPTGSQRAAIQQIIESGANAAVNLAKDLVHKGPSPADLLMVMPHGDGKYIVLDGNRRVSAIKVLNRPELLHDAQIEKRFASIAATGDVPDYLECVVFETREEAEAWIAKRHDGPDEGRGLVPWSAEDKQRFNRKPNTQTDRALRFADAIEQYLSDYPDIIDSLNRERTDRLTTLGRMVSDDGVQAVIGFEFADDAVKFSYPPVELAAGIRRILAEVHKGVNNIKNRAERRAIVEDMKRNQQVPDASKILTEAVAVVDGVVIPPENVSAEKTSPKRRVKNRQQTRLYQNVHVDSFGEGVRGLLRETKRLEVASNVHVASVILRVLLELAITERGMQGGWVNDSLSLSDKVKKAVLHIDPDHAGKRPQAREKDLEPIWNEAQNPQGWAISTLNSFIHNYAAHPNVDTILSLSEMFTPLINRLDDDDDGLS